MSRANPFEASSGEICISKTRLTSKSSSFSVNVMVSAANPLLSTRLNSISSEVISYPASLHVPASISSHVELGSADEIASNTEGKSCLHFLPSIFLFGDNSICWNLSKSFTVEIFSTFNSSARIS